MNEYDAAAHFLDTYYEKNLNKIKDRRRFSDDELDEIYRDFAAKYSPKALSEIPEHSVLDKVFNHRRAESMVGRLYNVKSENPLSDFGHIEKQAINNLLIYEKDGLWKKGKKALSSAKTKRVHTDTRYCKNCVRYFLRCRRLLAWMTMENFMKRSRIYVFRTLGCINICI